MRGGNAKRGRLSLAVFAVVIGVDFGIVGDTTAAETAVEIIVPAGLIDQKAVTKVNPSLGTLYLEYQAWRSSATPDKWVRFRSKNPLIRLSDGYVVINAVASADPERLRADLERLGMKNAAVYGRMVSGYLPIMAIQALEALESLKFVRPAIWRTNTGSVDSEGDVAMRSDLARANLGVDGTGVTVGVLSDSFDCLSGAAVGVLSGDLPAGINVVREIDNCAQGTDEGRAMMELIHDVARGATLAFHTAAEVQPVFARGITELRKAGAKVIVDDTIHLDEPMFQDGIIAQAVDSVVARGVAYFSAAGNEGRQSYQSRFRPSGRFVQEGPSLLCEAHDFDPSAKVDIRQRIRLPADGVLLLSFQWDQPFFSVSGPPGAQSDIDILLLQAGTNPPVPVAGGVNVNVGGDPVEIFGVQNTSEAPARFDIVITNCSGPDPQRIKYVDFGGDATILQFDTRSGTIYGHANARGAEAVGAADYLQTPAFGVNPPVIESFSSAGGVPIRLNTDGSRKRNQEVRKKPGIVAPDGANTTFFFSDRPDDADDFPNFFGTSAAAPHAAGVAALTLQNNPTFVPNFVYRQLRASAIDMRAPGFDFRTGFGLIDATLAAVPGSPGACQGVTATITGSPAADIIIGTARRDVILGGRGTDLIDGRGGGDLICGNAGNDTLKGGRGRDRLNGGSGDDFCDGGPGRDSARSCDRRVSIP